MTKTEESLHHHPDGILEEVLVRFPAKSLLQFRCVSKQWLSLINSKRFIKSHSKYSRKHTDSGRQIVLIIDDSGEVKQCSLLELAAGTDPSPLSHHMSQKFVPESCYSDGVFCFYVRPHGHILLLNPTTRASKELPKDPETTGYGKRGVILYQMGLGWDEPSGAYKVFVSWLHWIDGANSFEGRVYSSETNTWKTVEIPCFYVNGGQGKFAGGKLHWLSREMKIISSFDVKSEVFGAIELPVDPRVEDRLLLGVVGDSLCLLYSYTMIELELWVMKESWEKLPTIHLAPEILQNRMSSYADIIGEAANGDILIAYGRSFLVYCPKNGVIRHCREFNGRAKLYVERLTSFDV